MKKIIGISIAAIILIPILFAISVPIVNNSTAWNIESDLRKILLPSDTEIIDSLSNAGKVTGNGNGMQYLGAFLVKSELSVEELQAHYAEYDDGIYVKKQTESELDIIEHGSLSFSAKVPADDGYYIVYSWGSGIPIYSEIDLRGH